MSSSVIFFGWNRSVARREKISAVHFDEFVKYLGGRQAKGEIEGFDAVLLDSHGGDLNGFFLIKGEPTKLDALTSTDEWIKHLTRAALHLEGSGAVRGVTGDAIAKRMEIWTGAIPA